MHRLGLRIGIEDPEQWLENCPERVLSNWIAAYRSEPFGGEQHLLAKIVGLLYVLCMNNVRGEFTFEKVQELSDMFMQSSMPGDWVGQPKPKQVEGDSSGIAEFEKQVAARFS